MESDKTTSALGGSNVTRNELPSNRALQHYKAPKFDVAHYPVSPSSLSENMYRSASVLLKAISDEALLWQQDLPEHFRPAVLAVMHGGIQIKVETLSQISFHGIRVTGLLNDAPCSMLAHQSSIQLLCYGEEILENKPRNPIGFIWDGHEVEV